MSLKLFLRLSMVCGALLCQSCSDSDDADTSLNNWRNENANPSAIAGARRLEIPALKGGEGNLFLVHATGPYGVNFCVEWDCTKKAQRWTAYQMYESNSKINWNRNFWKNTEWGRDPFQPDPTLPEEYRTEQSHYEGSGCQRGHICPSADRLCSKEANEQTFYFSNIQPQLSGFNTGVWLAMENQVRTWNTASFRDTLYVVKGGTIDRADYISRTTSKGLLVPKYFFMAVLCKNKSTSQGGYKAMAFWVEHTSNSDTSLRKYMISVAELEQRTGIDFFCNLPDGIEEVVEQNLVPAVWGFNN